MKQFTEVTVKFCPSPLASTEERTAGNPSSRKKKKLPRERVIGLNGAKQRAYAQLARDSFVLGQQQVYTASWHWTRAVDEYFAFEQHIDDSKRERACLKSKAFWKINTQKVINFRVLGIPHAHAHTRCVRDSLHN